MLRLPGCGAARRRCQAASLTVQYDHRSPSILSVTPGHRHRLRAAVPTGHQLLLTVTGKESVPKITTNDAIIFFLKLPSVFW